VNLGKRPDEPSVYARAVALDDAQTAFAVTTQSDFGIKPCSTLFGRLKVVDDVEVVLAATL
jgi:hypothetical protein